MVHYNVSDPTTTDKQSVRASQDFDKPNSWQQLTDREKKNHTFRARRTRENTTFALRRYFVKKNLFILCFHFQIVLLTIPRVFYKQISVRKVKFLPKNRVLEVTFPVTCPNCVLLSFQPYNAA